MTTETLKRWWSYVYPDPNTGCWLWGGCILRGYGQLSVGGKAKRSHRLAYEHFVGEIPEGLVVMHMCNNPSCVNPDHLRVGTQAENIAHCLASGRKAIGERVPCSKLSAEIVRKVRASAEPTKVLARKYGVDPATMRLARRRDSWAHVGGKP